MCACGVWGGEGSDGGRGVHSPATLTDEEDGECDEEEEDVRHHVERVEEAAVVQDPGVHVVGRRVILAPAECQGHGGTGTLPRTPGQTASEEEEEEEDEKRQRREESKQMLSEHIQPLGGPTLPSTVEYPDRTPAPLTKSSPAESGSVSVGGEEGSRRSSPLPRQLPAA